MESSEWAVSRWCLQPTRWVCATVIVSNQVSHSSIICKGLKNVKIWLGRERIIFQSQWNLTKTQSLATWGIPVRCQTFSKDPRTSLQKWSQQKRCKSSDCFVPDFVFSQLSFAQQARSLQIPSLYLEIRSFLDMSVLVRQFSPPTEAPRHLFPGWWWAGSGNCCSSLQGDALPEKWDTQVSVEICVLKSQFFWE